MRALDGCGERRSISDAIMRERLSFPVEMLTFIRDRCDKYYREGFAAPEELADKSEEGYSFGLGLFETILLYNGKPVFLDEHLARINNSIIDLSLTIDKLEKNEVFQYLNNNKNTLEYEA